MYFSWSHLAYWDISRTDTEYFQSIHSWQELLTSTSVHYVWICFIKAQQIQSSHNKPSMLHGGSHRGNDDRIHLHTSAPTNPSTNSNHPSHSHTGKVAEVCCPRTQLQYASVGAWNQTANLPVIRRPAVPSDLLLPQTSNHPNLMPWGPFWWRTPKWLWP